MSIKLTNFLRLKKFTGVCLARLMLVTTLQAGAEGKRPIEDALIQAATASQTAAASVAYAPHVQAPVILPAEMTGEAVQEDAPPKPKGPPKRKRRKRVKKTQAPVAQNAGPSWAALPPELLGMIAEYLIDDVVMPSTPWQMCNQRGKPFRQLLAAEDIQHFYKMARICRKWWHALKGLRKYTLLHRIPIKNFRFEPFEPGKTVLPRTALLEDSDSPYRLLPVKTIFELRNREDHEAIWENNGAGYQLGYYRLWDFLRKECRARAAKQQITLEDRLNLPCPADLKPFLNTRNFFKSHLSPEKIAGQRILLADNAKTGSTVHITDLGTLLPFSLADSQENLKNSFTRLYIKNVIAFPLYLFIKKVFFLDGCSFLLQDFPDVICSPALLHILYKKKANYEINLGTKAVEPLRTLPQALRANLSQRIEGLHLSNEAIEHFSDAGMPNLRKLWISNDAHHRVLASLEGHPFFRAPTNKGALRKLRTLTLSGSFAKISPPALSDLPHLRDLHISDYQDFPALNRLKALRHLDMRRVDTVSDIDLSNLKTLDVDCCQHLTSVRLPLLTHLTLTGCEALTHLNLPNVKEAKIKSCNNLTSLALPRVEKLTLEKCRNLTDLTQCPRVQTLFLYDDMSRLPFEEPRNLTTLKGFAHLKEVCIKCILAKIEDCPALVKLTANWTEMPVLINCKAMRSIDLIGSLQAMANLQVCEENGTLQNLERLKIEKCCDLVSLRGLAALKRCILIRNDKLSFVGDLPALEGLTMNFNKSVTAQLTLKNMPRLKKCWGKKSAKQPPAVIENCGPAEPALNKRFAHK